MKRREEKPKNNAYIQNPTFIDEAERGARGVNNEDEAAPNWEAQMERELLEEALGSVPFASFIAVSAPKQQRRAIRGFLLHCNLPDTRNHL